MLAPEKTKRKGSFEMRDKKEREKSTMGTRDKDMLFPVEEREQGRQSASTLPTLLLTHGLHQLPMHSWGADGKGHHADQNGAAGSPIFGAML